MPKHTPEPWSRNISASYPIFHEWVRPDGRRNNRKIAIVLGKDEQAEADLHRIVACVNACTGLDTPEKTVPELIEAFESLMQDVESVICDPKFYGFEITDPQHPWHDSVMKARAVREKLP